MSPLKMLVGCLCIFVLLHLNIPDTYGQLKMPDKISAPKLPKVSAPKLPADTAVKAKLIKRILSVFQFRKNARAREQERVVTIINQILSDSLVVTARDIQALNEQLSKAENQHFDSLKSMLEALAAEQHAAPPEKDETPEPAQEPTPAPAPAPTQQESDLDALVNKMVPILQQNEDMAPAEKAKAEKLKQIREVYGRSSNRVDTLREDSVDILYTLKLTQTVNITGMQPLAMDAQSAHYNYSALSTLGLLGCTINGRTGRLYRNFNMDSLHAVQAARKSGCNIQLIISDNDSLNISALLQQPDVQLLLADTLASVLHQLQGNGVTIYFRQVKQDQRDALTSFINTLAGHLRTYQANYSVNVVIPSFDRQQIYDLQAMNQAVTFFFIDFTQVNSKVAGPLAPLKSGSPALSISGTVTRYLYLQKDIPSSKYVLLMSNYGAVWSKSLSGGPDVFRGYISYSDIMNKYADDSLMYDENEESALIEIKNNDGDVTGEIWFDDCNTLGPKYDYILNNGLGGVAIWTLGADDGYGDLWDELAFKFVTIDTVYQKSVPIVPETFWTRVMRELTAYKEMFQNPCSVKASDYEGDVYFKYAALILLVLVVLTAVLYILGVRNFGDDWKWKKAVLIALIVLLCLLVITGAMAIFLNKQLPWLGISDEPGKCHSIPLNTILTILGGGFIIGLISTRFLILPLLKRDEIP